MPPFLSRQERFDVVGSTNDVVRGWLAEGTPEVRLAVAAEQASLLAAWGRSELDRACRHCCCCRSISASSARSGPGLAPRGHGVARHGRRGGGGGRAARPNDHAEVAERSLCVSGRRRAAEARGRSSVRPTASEASTRALPSGSASTPTGLRRVPTRARGHDDLLSEASRGRLIDRTLLLDAFLSRLEDGIDALRDGRFDAAGWTARQLTTGRRSSSSSPAAAAGSTALGVDAESGGLVVEDTTRFGRTDPPRRRGAASASRTAQVGV